MKPKSLFIVVFLLLSSWMPSEPSAFVYDTATYIVGPYVAAHSPSVNDSDYIVSATPGISSTVSLSGTTYAASATSSVAADSSHTSNGNVMVDNAPYDLINQSYSSSYPYTDATATFTATSSTIPLHVSFNFSLEIAANAMMFQYDNGSYGYSYANASAELHFNLRDMDTGTTWRNYEQAIAVDAVVNNSSSDDHQADSLFGTFDEIIYITTTPGNQFELNFSTYIDMEAYIKGDATGSLSLTNINVEAVPIPGAVWLLGSGLLGLIGLRRKRD